MASSRPELHSQFMIPSDTACAELMRHKPKLTVQAEHSAEHAGHSVELADVGEGVERRESERRDGRRLKEIRTKRYICVISSSVG